VHQILILNLNQKKEKEKKKSPHSIGLRGKQVVSQPEGNAPPDFPLRHQGGALDLPQKNVNNINALKFYH